MALAVQSARAGTVSIIGASTAMRGVAGELHIRQRVPQSHTSLAYISHDRILSVFSPPGTELWVKNKRGYEKNLIMKYLYPQSSFYSCLPLPSLPSMEASTLVLIGGRTWGFVLWIIVWDLLCCLPHHMAVSKKRDERKTPW